MSSGILCTVLVLTLAAELQLQLTSCQTSQHGNSPLPVTYSATALEEGEQVCPPEEQQEIARAEIGQDIRNTIHNGHIMSRSSPGESSSYSFI